MTHEHEAAHAAAMALTLDPGDSFLIRVTDDEALPAVQAVEAEIDVQYRAAAATGVEAVPPREIEVLDLERPPGRLVIARVA